MNDQWILLSPHHPTASSQNPWLQMWLFTLSCQCPFPVNWQGWGRPGSEQWVNGQANIGYADKTDCLRVPWESAKNGKYAQWHPAESCHIKLEQFIPTVRSKVNKWMLGSFLINDYDQEINKVRDQIVSMVTQRLPPSAFSLLLQQNALSKNAYTVFGGWERTSAYLPQIGFLWQAEEMIPPQCRLVSKEFIGVIYRNMDDSK